VAVSFQNDDADPIQVVLSMCEVLGHLYRKFLDPSSESPQQYEAINKVDARLKSVFFAPLSRDLTTLSLELLDEAIPVLSKLRPHA